MIVRFLIKPEVPAIIQILAKRLLFFYPSDQLFNRGLHFFVFNPVILLLLRPPLQPLPRQAPLQKIQHYVPDALTVVPPRLLHPQMRVDRRIPRRPCQLLVVPVRDVLAGLRLPVTLRETEVYDVDDVLRFFLSEAHQEVVGFDVSVEEVVRVQEFDALQDLIREHQHGL